MMDIKTQAFNNLILTGMPEDQARDVAEVFVWAAGGDFNKVVALIGILVRPDRPRYAKGIADEIRRAKDDD